MKRRNTLRMILSLAIVILGGSCDLAMYDEESIRGAQRAQDFELLARAEYTGWDYRDDEDDRLIQPHGFYPDGLKETTGYLVYDEAFSLRVWRIEGGGIIPDISLGLNPETVHGDWDAWVVPIDSALSNPSGYRPLLLVGVWGDDRNVTLHGVQYDPTTGAMRTGELDLLNLALSVAAGAGTNEILSVNVAGFGPASSRGGGAPVSTTAGSDLQLLVRTGGGTVKELVFRGSGIDFVDWALGNPAALTSSQGTIANGFPLPTRSDGDIPVGIRHATDFRTITGILVFHDGDYSSAPRQAYTWASDATTDPAVGYQWSGRISSISYGGALRTGRSGSFQVVSNLNTSPAISTEDNGSIWYAGQFRDGGGSAAPMSDIYTQVGVVQSLGDGVLTVGVYK